ncbi:MAG: DoxX family protein [Dysgonamonadaceae bacterium]|jgi:uncharacterized membrane protein YphA (DoxX/SURF4 family)|nr:DoxX family protein [Dysgonamonadaceae bacterium]
MKIPDILKKIIVEFCRLFLGAVFIFSGFVKAVDPMGTMYKTMDYLSAFGLDIFNVSVLPLAFAQSAIEFAMGVCLLLGVYRRFHAVLFLAFMCVMTPLTLYLAIKNPVTDCGCFGDALVITNWQTFYKNIFLLAASLVVFFEYKRIIPFFYRKKFSVTFFVYAFILSVSLYCYLYLPILDFRPYKIGANIPELMVVPEDAPTDEYETTLIYSKDGVEQAFTLEDYPKGDTAWTFVDTRTHLIKKGYKPPVHDFSITTEEGDDITEDVLKDASYTFLLIAHKLEKANDSKIELINEIYDYCTQNRYKFYCLTSSGTNEIKEWKENTGAEYPFCIVDDITLKTIVRSNPGLLLLKKGIIVNKWSNRRIPDEKALNRLPEDSQWGQIPPNQEGCTVGLLSFAFVLCLFVFFLNDRRKKLKKNTNNHS